MSDLIAFVEFVGLAIALMVVAPFIFILFIKWIAFLMDWLGAP